MYVIPVFAWLMLGKFPVSPVDQGTYPNYDGFNEENEYCILCIIEYVTIQVDMIWSQVMAT